MKEFSELLTKERNGGTYESMALKTGIAYQNISVWERGLAKPRRATIIKIGKAFDWSDETVEKLLKQHGGKSQPKRVKNELAEKVVAISQQHGMIQPELLKVLGTNKNTLYSIRKNGRAIPPDVEEKMQKIVDGEISLSRKNGEKLNIPLINKVLERYKHLGPNELPADDPNVIEMRRNVGA